MLLSQTIHWTQRIQSRVPRGYLYDRSYTSRPVEPSLKSQELTVDPWIMTDERWKREVIPYR
ncbi:MAG: hypothetical protein NT069_15730, partial [Planctomycetota bacterium]|nr:hypothetical protein [Planctomycetota bacterium]